MSEQEYEALKAQIKQEIISELCIASQISKISVGNRQSQIFEEYFGSPPHGNDEIYRYRKLRQAIGTLTNVCRPRERSASTDLHATYRSEREIETAIQTFRAICEVAKRVYGESFDKEQSA